MCKWINLEIDLEIVLLQYLATIFKDRYVINVGQIYQMLQKGYHIKAINSALWSP
jgi:hypothetical protein